MPAFRRVKKNGRPPKLNDELTEKICQVLRLGAYVETAVIVNGVSKQVFYDWCKLANKQPNSKYAKFLDAVSKAMEESTTRDLLNIDKCAMGQDWEYERYPEGSKDSEGNDISGQLMLNSRGNPIPKKMGIAPDWQASAWRLERRRPKEWSKTEKVELTGKDGGPVQNAEIKDEATLKKILDENLRKLKMLE